MTISIAIERYMNVCHPTNRSSYYKKFLFPLPIIFSIFYNIPKFFEIVKCNQDEMNHTMLTHLLANENDTADITLFHNNGRNKTIVFDEAADQGKNLCDPYGTRATSLRNNKWYIIFYVFLSELVFVEILPWITVIILNIRTWKGITRFQKKRQALKRKSSINTPLCTKGKKPCNLFKPYHQHFMEILDI